MKKKNYYIDTSKKPVIITWSRNYASLLGSFGFFVKKDNDYFDVYTEITYYNKKIKECSYHVYKDEIVSFLQKRGANIELGKTTGKPRNLRFSNFNS